MEFTQEQRKRVDYFRRSVRLDDANVTSDPAYQFSDEDLWSILEFVTPIHKGLSIDETADSEFYFILLLAKREIYYRLATTSAPFYPLNAEGASLEKNVRFDHYIKLVEVVSKEYDELTKRADLNDEGGVSGVVTTYNSKLFGKGYLRRYDQLSEDIYIDVNVSGITENSVNLDWSRYSSTHGSDFLEYRIYVSEEAVYDEYSPEETKITVKPLHRIKDIRKNKVRITNLDKGKEYYLLVEARNSLGISGLSQTKFKTLGDTVLEKPRDEELMLGGDNT